MLSHVMILNAATFGFLHNSIRFMTWILNRPQLVFKRNETKKNTTRNSENLSHVTILHGFFAQLNWYVW